MKWSKYQKAVFKNVAGGKGHTIVEAVAGAGKTSVIIESLKHIPEGVTWLLVAFNKKIATELKRRAPSSFNGEIKTLHSLGFKTCKKRWPNIDLDNEKVSKILNSIVGKDRKLNDVKYQMRKAISLCKACLVSSPEEIDLLIDAYDIDIVDMSREKFINHISSALLKCFEITSHLDFDDMLWLVHMYDLPCYKYDYIFIDESQDLNESQLKLARSSCTEGGRIFMVGDPHQCVDKSTIVNTPEGPATIGEIKVGDEVATYKNTKFTFRKVTNKHKSNWESGFEIVTSSGKKILMSPTHKIWAKLPKLKENQRVIYLMYRNGFGFRIGKTNFIQNKTESFGQRTASESADKLWVIEIAESEDDALFIEESLSLQFGIPRAVFNGTHRGLNQNRINRIYKSFGQNGQKLLNHKYYSYDHPHWFAQGATSDRCSANRKILNINAHTSKYSSNVSFEWSDKTILNKLDEANIPYTKGFTKTGSPNFRIRKYFGKYTDAVKFAHLVSKQTGAMIKERLSFNRTGPLLIPASGLFVGSKILVKNGDLLEYDEIITIKKKEGVFFDIEVEDTANFIGNNILSHNSIYIWNGASADVMDRTLKELNAKKLPLSVTYRCPINVVSKAKQYCKQIEAAPNASKGTVEYISYKKMIKEAKPGCFILSRTNAPLIKVALNFIKRNIPCNIQGRDLGSNLQNMIKKSRRKNIESFLEWLHKWEVKEIKRLQEKGRPILNVTDKAACLKALASGCNSIQEMKGKISELFDDHDDADVIMCSSIHKSKGLERKVVYLLNSSFFGGSKEEQHVRYVGITRSMDTLYLVNGLR